MKKFILALITSLTLGITCHAGWVPQVSGAGFWLRGVDFADSLHGIAVGDSQALLRTVDGGANWQIVGSGVYGRSVDMVTSQIGWFVGGSVWKTTNGGLNWTPQGTGGQAVSFSNLQHGLVVGLGGYINRTTNGGSTWVQESSGVTFDLFDVCMVDSNHAWACGYDDTMPILVTRDGGQTWTRQRMPNGGTTLLTGISFSDTLHGLGVGWDQPIQWTENGGTTWQRVIPPDGKQKTDVILVDSLWGWLVGTPWMDSTAVIDRTTDGGRTWTGQTPGTTQRLFSVSFTDRRNGWAVGDGGTIVHTSDGGVGVEEEAEGRMQKTEDRITARPNPFTSYASIPGRENERFEVYDISGRRVGTYRGNRVAEDAGPGVYFIRLESQDLSLQRIVKVQ